MREPFKAAPKIEDDVLRTIFKLLPLVSQIKASELNRGWYKTIHYHQDFKIHAKDLIASAFDGSISPKGFRFGVEGFFSQKIDLKALKLSQGNILWDSILYMLMTHIGDVSFAEINLATDELLMLNKQAKEELKENKPPSHDILLNSILMRSLYMTQYGRGSQDYKMRERNDFLEFSRVDKPIFINFDEANLSSENLFKANFPGSSFIKADLIKTVFVQANLMETNLRGASVSSANFEGANLMGADLRDIRGTPIFDHYCNLIGAKMGLKDFCLERAAKDAGAIFTLSDLARRIKEKPEAFPNSDLLFIQAVRILLERKIEIFEKTSAEDRDGLVFVKLDIFRRLLPVIKNAEKNQDIKALREAIKNVVENKNMKHVDTNEKVTPYQIFSKPRALLSSACKELDIFSDRIHTDSQNIIDEVRIALDILDPPKPEATKPKPVVEANYDQDTDYSCVYSLPKY